MKSFFNVKCLVYPIVFMSFENLFLLHYIFHDQKIAVNFHIKEMCMPFTKEPNELMKLPGKFLKLQGWEVLELSET